MKLMLNQARRLNDGSYPLVMQLLHRRRKRVIYSGIYLYPGEWDSQRYTVILSKAKYRLQKDIRAMNRRLHEFVQRIGAIIEKLEQCGEPYTCDDIADRYLIAERDGSLADYWQVYISELRTAGRLGMAQAQQYTLNSVAGFCGMAHISFRQITSAFIQGYERYLLARGLSVNTVCYYMRNFRTVVNHAVRSGVANQTGSSVFEGIGTHPRKTMKRALTRDMLRSLAQMECCGDSYLSLTRDLFLFSFYTRGMAFVDIAFLTREDISGNVIHYRRRKTGQPLQISINEPIREILSRYPDVSHYIFPVVRSVAPEPAYREYRSALRRINKVLKVIGGQLGFPLPLTTYVARHSWATQAKELGFPVSVISEGLGHTSEKTTRIYLKEFDHRVLDDANDVIVRLV